jgi:peptide deformylase
MRLPGRYPGTAKPIVTYGSDPVLHRPCAPVAEFDRELRRLVLDMFASMEAADGVGLAANQIGVDARVFVIDCPDAAGEDVVGYVVNPVLTVLDPREGEPAEEVTEEGCLSVPGPYAELPRAFRARVDGVDAAGDPV